MFKIIVYRKVLILSTKLIGTFNVNFTDIIRKGIILNANIIGINRSNPMGIIWFTNDIVISEFIDEIIIIRREF